MNVVRVKPGSRFDVLAPGGIHILAAIDVVARTVGVDMLITCGSEGHDAADPHTRGEAFDIRVGDFSIDQQLAVRRALIDLLGPAFTVLYERPTAAPDPRLAVVAFVNPHATAPHIHIQVKQGTIYPPHIAPAAPAAV